jgi:hypothetical protein
MPAVEAVGMWESQRDFQRMWEGWKAGFLAFHTFHILSFPWPALECVFKERSYRKTPFPRNSYLGLSLRACLLPRNKVLANEGLRVSDTPRSSRQPSSWLSRISGC